MENYKTSPPGSPGVIPQANQRADLISTLLACEQVKASLSEALAHSSSFEPPILGEDNVLPQE